MTSNVTIRPADLEGDALAIVDGARDFIARMDYREILPADNEEIVAAVARLVTIPGVEVVVAEHEGEIVGGIGMLYSPFLWNAKVKAAEQLFVWTAKGAPPTTLLCLLRAVRQRMKDENCEFANFKANLNHPGFDGVLCRMGLRPVETVYIGAPKCQ